MITLCAINECLYFPFLDNANVLIQTRFCVPHTKTGFYLCLPFISAIITTAFFGETIMSKYLRKDLIFFCSLFPLVGHLTIFFITNCDGETSLQEEFFLAIGLIFFGMGLGSYYAVSFPAVGLSVPSGIRGTDFNT